MEKRRVRLYKAQEGGQPSIEQLGYPGAQAQEQQASGEEQLMQIIYQDISNEVPEGAIVAKLVNAYNLDPAMANQYVQQVYGILQNKIDQDEPEEEEEDNSEEEAQEQVEEEVLNENKPMSKIRGNTDLAMDDEEIDVMDLGDEDMMRYGGTPRYQDGGEEDYLNEMNNDGNTWSGPQQQIVFPDVSEYLPSGMEQYLSNAAADIAWASPEESEEAIDEQSSADYVDPAVDPEEFKMGGFKTKKGYVNSVLKLVKKQMGGEDSEADVKASDADPRGDDLRKNRLDAFVGSIKKEGNMAIAKEEAEKQFEQMQAMHQQMMMPQPQLQQFIPEDYEGMDEMQFGGQQRRAMRRMNRAIKHLPGGAPGMMGPITKFDVRKTGIFGGPKEYTVEFGENPLVQLANNPLLSQAYGYGYKAKTTKTPGKLITEKVRTTINNEATKEVAKATGTDATAKSAGVPTLEEMRAAATAAGDAGTWGTSPASTTTQEKSNVPEAVTELFGKNPPKVGETNSDYLMRVTGNPGYYRNTDVWDGTKFVGNSLNKKQQGGVIDNPMPDQFGNLQRFMSGGDEEISQEDIDDMYSKDTSDPYMPEAQFGGGFWGAMMRNYFPANLPQRGYYSKMMRPAYNKATGQQFANMPGYNPNALIKDINVTKTGVFGRPKNYTVTYNNNPSGKPEDRRLAGTNSFTQDSTSKAAAKSKEQAPKTKDEQRKFSNTEGLSNSAQRQIRQGERRTAREVGRGEEEFPETTDTTPRLGNLEYMQQAKNRNWSYQDTPGVGAQYYGPGLKANQVEKREPVNNTPARVIDPSKAFLGKNQYGGLNRFLPQALLGDETPVSMENNPANSKLTLPTRSSKEVGQELMMDSRKKLQEEANYEPDEYSVDYKNKKQWLGDNQGAILSANAGIEGLAGFIDRAKNNKRQAKMYENLTADNLYASDPSRDRGDYVISGTDKGLYRPDEQGQNWGSRSAQQGGSSNYTEGAIVDMTEEELADFIANGGQVEYL
jgi:hypothetical protein